MIPPPRECGAPGLRGDAPPLQPAATSRSDIAAIQAEREREKAERKARHAKMRRKLGEMLGPMAFDLAERFTEQRRDEPGRLTLAIDEADGDGYAVAFLDDGEWLHIGLLRDTGKIERIGFRIDGEVGRALLDLAERIRPRVKPAPPVNP